MRFIFLTIDGNHGAALREAAELLRRDQGIDLALSTYDATSLRSEADWQRLERDVARADFIFGARLFGEEFVRPLERVLTAAKCPVCIITSNPTLIHQTRIGKFVLGRPDGDAEPGLLQQWIRKLRPKGGSGEAQRQLAILRNLSKVLKLIPGKARDIYTYVVAHQFWLNNSPENLRRMLCLLIDRYVPSHKGKLPVLDPLTYPDVALFHPDAAEPFAELDAYLKWRSSTRGRAKNQQQPGSAGTVGILTLRTVALSGNTAHLDALVRALEARGLEARLAYASGLDFRPAIEKFFRATAPEAGAKKRRGRAQQAEQAGVDLLINGASFALVGGPAESRPDDARAMLEQLDVGYLTAIPLSFQRIEDWQRDDTGLSPMQLVMNVAIPELDGAAEPLVIGGPTAGRDAFVALPDQVAIAAERVARRVRLRRKANAEKKLAVVIFNFPPNLGNVGTAAFLDVFASLRKLLAELREQGYDVTVPESEEELRNALTGGNAALHGTDGNVAARLSVADYRRLFPEYADIEPFWGRAPGELLNDGKEFFILGAHFGNVFVGIQPGFGYERDPMRLLMAKDAAPHHGFAAFYTWLEHVYDADAVVHFGTHGALEFMPGKQAGLSDRCWPTRLLGSLPNFYVYSVNNPSEATIAKRRGAATTVSYLVPPLQQAGLYKGLRLLKDNLDRYRQRPDPAMLADIQTQARQLELAVDEARAENSDDEAFIAALYHELLQIEERMIPLGLHVFGASPAVQELVDLLALVATFTPSDRQGGKPLPQLIAAGLGWDYEFLRENLKRDRHAQEHWEQLDRTLREAVRRFVDGGATAADQYLQSAANLAPGKLASLWALMSDLVDRLLHNGELAGLLRALAGGFVPPSPANDLVRNPAIVPTGRNVHSLDPYRVPTTLALDTGRRLVDELLEQLTHEQGKLPETVAIVLWGSDNLKSDCEGVAQVLALLGVRTQTDELGNVCDVALIPLAELGRPRVDVVVTVSGIFRDLLYHQMQLLDKAARLAAQADEPDEFNFVRKHAREQAATMGISIEEAATRVFANAPGSYGANVNRLVESGTWDADDQLSDAFLSRKSFALGGQGQWHDARPLMERALATVDATFQNIDSFEVGISDIDNYYENLGGVTKAVERLRGERPPVMVAEATASTGRLSSLEQMVRLESRAKLLNPKWYDAMLAHGYEGAREIEARINNTYGWSATAGAVEGWVYQGVADTYLLDPNMRDRLTQLNPHAVTGMVRRLLEANHRGFWEADEATLEELYALYDDLEDRLEGIVEAGSA